MVKPRYCYVTCIYLDKESLSLEEYFYLRITMRVFVLCGCVLRIHPLTHSSSGELKLRSVFFSPPWNLIRQADAQVIFLSLPVIFLGKLHAQVSFFSPPCNKIRQIECLGQFFSPPCILIRPADASGYFFIPPFNYFRSVFLAHPVIRS